MLLLVEGTCGVGKTTLVRALAERCPEVVPLSQRVTYAPLVPAEDAGTLDDAQHRRFLDAMLRELVAMQRGRSAAALIVLDTFHVTQRLRPGVLSRSSFLAIDQQLAALGCRTLLLEAPEPVLFERAIVQRRGTGFARYAARFGSTEEDVAAYFAREQRQLREIVANDSQLPWESLTTTQARGELAAATIAFARGG